MPSFLLALLRRSLKLDAREDLVPTEHVPELIPDSPAYGNYPKHRGAPAARPSLHQAPVILEIASAATPLTQGFSSASANLASFLE